MNYKKFSFDLFQVKLKMNEADFTRRLMYEELKYYNTMHESCFRECIFSMASKELTKDERGCLHNCFKKTAKYNERFAQATTIARMNMQDAANSNS